jgi:ribosomal protein L11 methyltransferase
VKSNVNAPVKINSWQALHVDIEPNAREAVEYALMEAGALGTVTEDEYEGLLRISGYFSVIPDRELIRLELAEALRIYNLPSSAVRDMSLEEIANRDWLGEWKKTWQPVSVGRFIIAPPWSDLEKSNDSLIIRIEPGMAFGTGTHETTRLCLKAIEKHFAGGSFLDVGTGTGILAIAAVKLFPSAHVEACDTDEAAILIAKENARANGIENQIQFNPGTIDEASPSADLVCANLTADVISPLLRTLLSLSCGKLVLSGILETQLQSILNDLRTLGVMDVEVTRDGEWVCCVV